MDFIFGMIFLAAVLAFIVASLVTYSRRDKDWMHNVAPQASDESIFIDTSALVGLGKAPKAKDKDREVM